MALPRRENAFAHGQLMGKGYKDQEERKIATVTRNTIVTWLKKLHFYTFTVHHQNKKQTYDKKETDCDETLDGKQN